MGWLGLDDTDSLAGGCTTKAFRDLLDHLPEGVVVGEPRLVRLWPFAMRRTRGNAAVGVELKCTDAAQLMDFLDAWWNEHLLPLTGAVHPSTISNREQSPTSPGMVWFSYQPDESLYWQAVRGEVRLSELPNATRAWGDHGRIGASAAVAWPGEVCTWEAIAWRDQLALGPRRIDTEALVAVDAMEAVVLSRDPRKGTGLVAPRGRSPVLFGVRATQKLAAERACEVLIEGKGTESCVGWTVFRTNQASGDHLEPQLRLEVDEVLVHPQRKHAHIHTDGPTVLSYVEGGPVNRLARWLQRGDVILVQGLIDADGALHAERMKLESWVHRALERPTCATCDVKLKSMGKGQGLRCPSCKERSDDRWVPVPCEPLFDAWVEPPVDARRHLARPLGWDKLQQLDGASKR